MKSLKVTKIIFAVVFGIPLIVWFFLLGSHIHNVNLVKNGEHTMAHVDSFYSSYIENDVPMYKLIYSFEVYGVKHTGETSADYIEYQVDDLYDNYIEIVYDPNTFDSIQADYDTSPSVVIYILPFFGLISVGFIISLVIDAVHDLRKIKISKYGKTTKALFLNAHNKVSVNHEPYYNIEYQYEDENGVSHKGKTRCCYNITQMTYLKAHNKFDVKYIGKYSTIVEDTSDEKMTKAAIAESEEFEKASTPEPKFKKCAFCGSLVDNDAKSCQNCGSRQFDKIEK